MSQHIDAIPKQSDVTTYDFGSDTIANLQTAMVAYAGNLPNNTTRNIVFSVSAVSDPFVVTTYVGTLTRIAATRIIVNAYQSMNSAVPIFGKYKDGTWEWNLAALNSRITTITETFTTNNDSNIDFGNSKQKILGVYNDSNQYYCLFVFWFGGRTYAKMKKITNSEDAPNTEMTITYVKLNS